MNTDEEIGDISLKQINGKTGSDASVSMHSHTLAVEYYEKALRSAPEWLVYRWAIGQAPRQIARETGYPVQDIYHMLKVLHRALASNTDNDFQKNEGVLEPSTPGHTSDLQ